MRNYVGIVTGDNKRFISNTAETNKRKKILVGRDLGRYSSRDPQRYVLFDPAKLHSNTDESVYGREQKILIRKTGNVLVGTLDVDQRFTEQTIYNLIPRGTIELDLKYFLALINSKLLQFYFRKKLITNPDAFPYIKGIHIDALPIRSLDLGKQPDKSRHDQMVKLVEQMLELHKHLAAAKTDYTKTNLQRQIDATDAQIDTLVYELYGLSNDEIKIVETAT